MSKHYVDDTVEVTSQTEVVVESDEDITVTTPTQITAEPEVLEQ